MSKYVRKTYDEYDIEGYYGPQYGWEVVCCEETYKEARLQLKCYRDNEPNVAHRIVKHRVRIEDK